MQGRGKGKRHNSLSKEFLVQEGKTSTGEPENEICTKMSDAQIFLGSQKKKRHEWAGAEVTLLHEVGGLLSSMRVLIWEEEPGSVSIRSTELRAQLSPWDWLCVVPSFCDQEQTWPETSLDIYVIQVLPSSYTPSSTRESPSVKTH